MGGQVKVESTGVRPASASPAMFASGRQNIVEYPSDRRDASTVQRGRDRALRIGVELWRQFHVRVEKRTLRVRCRLCRAGSFQVVRGSSWCKIIGKVKVCILCLLLARISN